MGRVRRHGVAIAVSAATWGLLITGFGLAPDIWAALGFLVLAGGADMASGIFRDTLWNQTIPDRLRARMAGLELLSYGLGPSAGQIRAGAVASVTSAQFSIASGGVFCAGGRPGLPGAARLHPLPGQARRSRGRAGLTDYNLGGRGRGSGKYQLRRLATLYGKMSVVATTIESAS